MKQIITGTLEFDSYMASDGDNVCFIVMHDDEKNKSLNEVAELFDRKKVKITFEEIK